MSSEIVIIYRRKTLNITTHRVNVLLLIDPQTHAHAQNKKIKQWHHRLVTNSCKYIHSEDWFIILEHSNRFTIYHGQHIQIDQKS